MFFFFFRLTEGVLSTPARECVHVRVSSSVHKLSSVNIKYHHSPFPGSEKKNMQNCCSRPAKRAEHKLRSDCDGNCV